MKKLSKIVILLILLNSTSFGQVQSQPVQKAADPNETILKYEQFLREETETHRKYTQEYYDTILQLFSALSIVVIGIVTWLNWKTKSEIHKQVNENFNETVQSLLNEKLKQIDLIIKDNKEKSAKQFESINKLILELSAKSEKTGSPAKGIIEEDKSDISDLKNKKILWVDDYPENNQYAKTILEQAGIKFTEALDTIPALAILKKEKFDLIISDMGRNSSASAGIDLLKELKKVNISTPVIICASPEAVKKHREEALLNGAIEITSGGTSLLNMVQKILLSK